MGSMPEVTRATMAPLPVGGTVNTVEFRMPFSFILLFKFLGRFLINWLLR